MHHFMRWTWLRTESSKKKYRNDVILSSFGFESKPSTIYNNFPHVKVHVETTPVLVLPVLSEWPLFVCARNVSESVADLSLVRVFTFSQSLILLDS